MKNEPVLTSAGLTALVLAVVAFTKAMGWLPFTSEQDGTFTVVVNLAVPLLFGFWARGKVTPN